MKILFAHTSGDDLIHPTKTAVVCSNDLVAIEHERDRRIIEQNKWTEKYGNQVPSWAIGGLISEYTIEEIPYLEAAMDMKRMAEALP